MCTKGRKTPIENYWSLEVGRWLNHPFPSKPLDYRNADKISKPYMKLGQLRGNSSKDSHDAA